MGITYSTFSIIRDALNEEITVTTNKDGNQSIETTKKNPWVSAIAVLSGTIVLIVYIDGGKGTITKSFGKVCMKCSKSMGKDIYTVKF